MKFADLTNAWAVILAAVSAFVLLSNAAEKIVKAYRAAKAPDEEQNRKITQLEDEIKEIKKKLEKDHDRFEGLDSGNRVTQQALLALLDHGIDGNNIEQMQHAKEALQAHLINK